MNDQAETLFLQLMRGAGAAGLAGMPAQAIRDRGMHLRPLLNFSRDELESFAYDNALDWVDDPSNQDTNLDRNFIRQQILPMLESRWPEVTSRLSSAARLQADNLELIESIAATDLANCIRVWQPVTAASVYDVLSVISIDHLLALPAARQLNLLRYWIIETLTQGVKGHRAISPTRKLLMEISGSMLSAQKDAEPRILFSGVEFRRYQDNLAIIRQRVEPTLHNEPLTLSPTESAHMGDTKISLIRSASPGQGLAPRIADKTLMLKYRQGGEELKPAGRAHSQRLKKLLQDNNIPPWDRGSLPLFYLGDELVAVADLFIADACKAADDEQGWCIVFEQAGQMHAQS
jgi:tRNA(Ile)-lysidine synthase